MKVLEDKHEVGFKWIKERPREHWCRALFEEDVKCDILLHNLAEAFNKYILTAREKPVLTMFEMIRTQLMKRINEKQKFGRHIDGELCPKTKKKLAKINEYGWKFTAIDGGSPLRTCTCRRWKLTGITCLHDCPCIYGNNQRPEEYVDDCYSKATYKKKKKGGRIPKARRKEAEELEKQRVEKPREAAQNREKLRRKGNMRMTCSLCGKFGHNKRGCLKNSGVCVFSFQGTRQVPHVSLTRRGMFPFVDKPPAVDQSQPNQNQSGQADEGEHALDSQQSIIEDGAPSQPS
ncbi:uncharacterized protein LOC126656990 [Mercurialis annua]|uniref:uncharacterized protein LOC126656990 n=1 Tax=Mercurialis annua TaxID=3986 RepID=UPI0021600A65|nr:uncharacterized protein LOC126656990 [Mercurialis annua]